MEELNLGESSGSVSSPVSEPIEVTPPSQAPEPKVEPKSEPTDFKSLAKAGLEKLSKPEAATAAPKAPEAKAVLPSAPVAPEFKPSYKFKVHKQEKEFDEWVRAAIKDADTEKKARELYEKAYGLDEIKPKHEKLKGEHQQILDAFVPINQNLQNWQSYIENKDFDRLFQDVGISEQDIKAWMLQKLQQKQLPPEQQQVYNQARTARDRAYELERENAALKQQAEGISQAQVQKAHMELDSLIAAPQFQNVAQAYDARFGEGAFKEEVIERGYRKYQKTQVNSSYEEMLSEMEALYGHLASPPKQATEPAAPAAQVSPTPKTPPVVAPRTMPPVIPNVAGKTTSPTKQHPTSLEDLKKIRRNMGPPTQ